MYQTRRSILWGFMHSLISKDLLVNYTWSGRSEDKSSKTKNSFAALIQIQSVIFSAIAKVVPTYSIKEFENDVKLNLMKCASKSKEKNNQP